MVPKSKSAVADSSAITILSGQSCGHAGAKDAEIDVNWSGGFSARFEPLGFAPRAGASQRCQSDVAKASVAGSEPMERSSWLSQRPVSGCAGKILASAWCVSGRIQGFAGSRRSAASRASSIRPTSISDDLPLISSPTTKIVYAPSLITIALCRGLPLPQPIEQHHGDQICNRSSFACGRPIGSAQWFWTEEPACGRRQRRFPHLWRRGDLWSPKLRLTRKYYLGHDFTPRICRSCLGLPPQTRSQFAT